MESVLKIFIYNFHNKAGTYLLHILYYIVVKLLRSVHMQVQVTMKQPKQRKNAKENKKEKDDKRDNQREEDPSQRNKRIRPL